MLQDSSLLYFVIDWVIIVTCNACTEITGHVLKMSRTLHLTRSQETRIPEYIILLYKNTLK